MPEKYKKWSCFLCEDIVIEGQRFGWIPDKGYIHIECLHEEIAKRFNGKIPVEIEALIDFDELAAYGITRAKQVEKLLTGELREKIEQGRHRLEGLSALAGTLLKETLKKYGIEF